MTISKRAAFRAITLIASLAPSSLAPQPPSQSFDRKIPILQNTCLISSDVKRLVEFYEPVLEQKAKWSGPDYAEFATGAETLAVFSATAQERYIPGSAAAAKNRSVILEFSTGDVDAEFRRLQAYVKIWVKPPTTQPWGTRSIYFRDPDGNLVDFYSPAPESR
jgi:uncharacterized glyoxalase superfamily protein PhnB